KERRTSMRNRLRGGLAAALFAGALALAAGCAQSGSGIGVARSPGEPAQRVIFVWDSGASSLSGNVATRLPSGETYRGRFLQGTQEAASPFVGYWAGWDPWGPWGGWGWGGSYWTRHYGGVAIAGLTSRSGNTMRCLFY